MNELQEAYEQDVAAAQAAKQSVVDLANAHTRLNQAQKHHEATTARVRALFAQLTPASAPVAPEKTPEAPPAS